MLGTCEGDDVAEEVDGAVLVGRRNGRADGMGLEGGGAIEAGTSRSLSSSSRLRLGMHAIRDIEKGERDGGTHWRCTCSITAAGLSKKFSRRR